MRDPVVLLLDEPTWDLDPLNTYFVISILANHAKKVGFTLICLNGIVISNYFLSIFQIFNFEFNSNTFYPYSTIESFF